MVALIFILGESPSSEGLISKKKEKIEAVTVRGDGLNGEYKVELKFK